MFRELTLQDRSRIREYYERASNECRGRLEMIDIYSVYPFNWSEYMSPLERLFWDWTKCEGLKLLPQYPIGKYFVDFVDPSLRVAFEIDGKEWHQDIEADEARQKEIEAHGLNFVRLRGRAVFKLDDDDEYGDYYREVIRSSLHDTSLSTTYLF